MNKKAIFQVLCFSSLILGVMSCKKSTTSSSTQKVSITAGGLSAALTADDKVAVTNLTITGYLNAEDFFEMRSYMPNLSVLDLTGDSIASYTGTATLGSNGLSTTIFPAQTVPDSAFINRKSLTIITLSSTFTAIGNKAFENCSGLRSFSISKSIQSIGNLAFAGCTCPISVDSANRYYASQSGILFDKNITRVIHAPASLSGSYAIPSTVVTLDTLSFFNCSALTDITIPSSVVSIQYATFKYCSSLVSISLPSSISSIDYLAFEGYAGQITVDANNPTFSSNGSVIFNKTQSSLIICPILINGSYTVPASVTSINALAFDGCIALTSIVLPNTISTIGNYAFINCTGLTSIYANAITPIDLTHSIGVFSNINPSTCVLHVPKGSKAAYQGAGQWNKFLNVVDDI